MADGRRRTWIAVDVDYYAGPLGLEIRHRFGPIGLVVFDAFLRACKRSFVEGQITYTCEADFLGVIGLPGMRLVNEGGEEWPLDALWSLLADHKQIRRRHRGLLTDVVSSKWSEWQQARPSRASVEQTRRSEAINTTQESHDSEHEESAKPACDFDLDSDQDHDKNLAASPLARAETSTNTNGEGRKRNTRLPEQFEMSAEMRAWAAEKYPEVDVVAETEHFCDYHRGRGSTQADWPATWRTWIRNVRKFSRNGSAPKVNGVSAAQAWERVSSALQRGQRPKFDDRTEAIVKAMGGWQQLRVSTNTIADRAHFIKFWEGS